jgi:prevent-host-death family protein
MTRSAAVGSIGVFEAKNRLSELLERVAHGEAITITRRGEPVARLVPAGPVEDRDRAQAAIAALRRARKGARLSGLSVGELRGEGRR